MPRTTPLAKRRAAIPVFLLTLACCLQLHAQIPGQVPEAGISETDTNAAQRRPGAEPVVVGTFRPGNLDIFYFSHPGEPPKRLTDDPGLDYDPVFSPDGRWLIYTSEVTGAPHLYALDLQNGGSPRLLIGSDHMQDQASFAPDGKSFVFVSAKDGTADIFTIGFKPEVTQRMSDARNLTHHPGGEFRPAYSPDGAKIAFTTDWDTRATGLPAQRSRDGEIYVMDRDGGNAKRLTRSPGWDGSPAWSRDGKTIYFYSEREASSRIYAMDENGANVRALSPKGPAALSPALMADGRIAFSVATGETGNNKPPQIWRIASVAPDGSGFRFETDTSATTNFWVPAVNCRTGAMAVYGPGPPQKDVPQGEAGIGDGPLLMPHSPVYVSLPDRTLALYAMRSFSPYIDPSGTKIVRTDSFRVSHTLIVSNLDGTDEHVIYTRPKGGRPIYAPVWSKDGRWISWMDGFAFGGLKEESDIWKIHPDGSGAVNLTPNTPGNDGFMDFSPDGHTIVFRSSRTGNFDVFLMNSDGLNVRNVTNNPAYDSFPAFSPTGDEIAFASNRDGDPDPQTRIPTFEIYTMKIKPDGSTGEMRRITDSPGQDCHAQYSPDGKWIIYVSERAGINDEEPLINQVFTTPQPYGELFVTRLSDGLTVRLTENKWEEGIPTWARALSTETATYRPRQNEDTVTELYQHK